MSAKYMSNIKSIGAFARLYCFVEICWNLHPFSELKNVFFANFRTFLKFSKCKALGDFLISFLERVPLKGCLGGISQNWNFCNWFDSRYFPTLALKYKMRDKCLLRQFWSKYESKINENVVIDKRFFNVVSRMTWVYSLTLVAFTISARDPRH